MKSSFGNYVVQKALKITTNGNKIKLVNTILNNVEKLGERKLICKWKKIVEDSIGIPVNQQINSNSFNNSFNNLNNLNNSNGSNNTFNSYSNININNNNCNFGSTNNFNLININNKMRFMNNNIIIPNRSFSGSFININNNDYFRNYVNNNFSQFNGK